MTTARGRRSAERARNTPKMSPREAGTLGARKRWGPHGIILRLDQCEPQVRRVIETILDAQEEYARKAAPASITPEAAPEVRRDRVERPSAAA
jgi:hypothetical protein